MGDRTAAIVFCFFALFYILTNSFRSEFQVPDEEYVLLVTSNLVGGRSLALPEGVPKVAAASDVGRDGKVYSAYQIGQSLLYAPFFFVTKQILKLSEPYSPRKFASPEKYEAWADLESRHYLYVCTSFFSALSCAVFFLFARRLGFSARCGLILTLLYGLGTMVWPYSKFLLTEAFQNALLSGTVYLLFAQRQEGRLRWKAMAVAGGAFGLLLSIRTLFALLLPVLAAYWFYRNRDKRLFLPALSFAVPMAAFLAPQLLYNYTRFHEIFSAGYKGTAGFATPLFVGLYGYLFSSGKSFFLYTPPALLFFWGIRRFLRRAPAEGWLFTAVAALVPLAYARSWLWSGDPSWGPRYLLVVTPFLLLPAGEFVEAAVASARLRRRAVLGALFAVSAAVQALGVSVHYLTYHRYVQQAATLLPPSRLTVSPRTPDGSLPIRDRYMESEFNPYYSPLLGHWWILKSVLSGERRAGEHAPWRALGYASFHSDVPIPGGLDLWVVNLFWHGLKWSNFRPILGAAALFIVWTIFAQELLVPLLRRPPRGDG